MNTTGAVYALTEPSTGEIRYIGQTTRTLGDRLNGHRQSGTPRVAEWIRSLSDRGEQPGIIELASDVPLGSLDAVERDHIEQHASPDLLNVTYNPHASAAVRAIPPREGSAKDPIPATMLRRMLGGVVEQVRAGEHIVIGRFDMPFAVFIPYADYVRKFGGAAQPTNPSASYGPDFSDGS